MPSQTLKKEEVKCEKLSRKLNYCKFLLTENYTVRWNQFGRPGSEYCHDLIKIFEKNCP
jgi:hypothetical protein